MTDLLITSLNLSSKLLIYMGIAAIIGGFFILTLSKRHPALVRYIRRYILIGTIIATLAVGINFYAQVGAFAEMGWAGMTDPTFVEMLWGASVGDSVMFRVIALGLVLCLMLLVLLYARTRLTTLNEGHINLLVIVMVGLGGILLAASFSLVGHTAELSLISRFLLSLHVFIALLWMGSLLPLWQACRVIDIQPLQQLMHRFGMTAMGLVLVLLVCGAILAYQLLGSLSELFFTTYGLMLLAKLALVDIILGFAAWHKWRLVPQLTDQAAAKRLQRSIMLECLVGLGILVVTVLLTTVVGPESMYE